MFMPATRILDFSEIPVIDIGPLVGGDRSREAETVEAIARACQDVGFMYVRQHGVSVATLDRLVAQAKLFFALPAAEKKSVPVEDSPQFRGYLPLEYTGNEGEKGKNLQEGFMIMHDRPCDAFQMHGPNQWPTALPSLRPAMWEYFAAMEKLAAPLMQGFAMALSLKSDFFDDVHRDPMSVLKLNHYPPQPPMDESEIIGVGGHCDGGSFTILWQDSLGGLEVPRCVGLTRHVTPSGPDTCEISQRLGRWTGKTIWNTDPYGWPGVANSRPP